MLADTRERSLNAIPPIAFAAAFWIVVTLIAILAVASAAVKGNPFTDFFVAFGAVGQVAFAYMVWKLSREQFAFTQLVANRQHQVDAYPIRKNLHTRLKRALKALLENPAQITEGRILELHDLHTEVEQLFSKGPASDLWELIETLDSLAPNAATIMTVIKLNAHQPEFREQIEEFSGAIDWAQDFQFEILNALEIEMSVHS